MSRGLVLPFDTQITTLNNLCQGRGVALILAFWGVFIVTEVISTTFCKEGRKRMAFLAWAKTITLSPFSARAKKA